MQKSNTTGLQWELLWEDHFDDFDQDRWEKATHTFSPSQFAKENVTFQNGTMKLHLTDKPTGKKSFSGAEYRTKEKYLYGKFVVRAKFAPGSGVVSSFFTFRDPIRPRWNEIDIEVLGKDMSVMQFTHWWDRSPNYIPKYFKLDFDMDKEFHEYDFQWTPDYIAWSIDGKEMYRVTENICDLSQQIMMNIWITNNDDWAGKFDRSVLPTFSEYDYVKYYKMK